MSKLLLTGFGGILGAAVLSAILMVANNPAQSLTVSAVEATDTAVSKPGRVTLVFEPLNETVDRN